MEFAQGRHSYLMSVALVLLVPVMLLHPACARSNFNQLGPKLVGSNGIGSSGQGSSVALSADGNTALVSGAEDNSQAGAMWVFTRSNGVWTQQGSKLIPTDEVGAAALTAVALSADGNTAAVGGRADNNAVGAVWIFTRNQGVWTQQGNKLVGTGGGGSFFQQGSSVALSADGNTVISGADDDNKSVGAAWVFTRSNGVWTQQGPKLVGTGSIGEAGQGSAVALSADGNTAVIGGNLDNNLVGAAWVFVRSNGVWTQQGNKLVGAGSAGQALQGSSAALSADGNTAAFGGFGDGDELGAVWVFVRNNGLWTQQGDKLVGTGSVGASGQGVSVALSADGNTLVVGGGEDNQVTGAAWVFTRRAGVWTQRQKLVGTAGGQSGLGRSAALSVDGRTALIGAPGDNQIGAAWIFFAEGQAHDFNDDGSSDIAWRDTEGNLAVWLMNGGQALQTAGLGTVPTTWSIVGQRDFNGDGFADLLWRDTSGNAAIWFLDGTQVLSTAGLGNVPSNWSVAGTGDFNGDGYGDILWRDTDGNTAIWLMSGGTVLSAGALGEIPTNWMVANTGDFDGDGKSDILWLDTAGNVAIWLMNGLQILQAGEPGQVATAWSVVGTGDFNGDGDADILWRDSEGNTAVWLMNGLEFIGIGTLGMVPSSWSIAETGDFDFDGNVDILWRDANEGAGTLFFMNGTQISRIVSLGVVPTDWTIQGVNAD
jgi:hypothetical protein